MLELLYSLRLTNVIELVTGGIKLRHCCAIYEGFIPRIQELLTSELGKVEPSYLAQPALKVLKSIGGFCPVCGDEYESDEPVKSHPKRRKKHDIPAPPIEASIVPCAACKGKGKLSGADKTGMSTICIHCLGKGKIDNTAEVKAQLAIAKATDARMRADARQRKKKK